MPNVTTDACVRALEIEQVVVRCGCTEEEKRSANFHALRGEVCPNPRAIENNGVVVRWHRNPLRRALYAARRFFTRKV